MAVWLAQSLFAWFILIVSLVATGALLSYLVPRRHQAAKLAGIKWSLYAIPVLVFALAAWYGYHFARPGTFQSWWGTSYNLPPSPIPAWVLAVVYGAWWSVGMACNPFHARSSIPPLITFAALYAGAWAAITHLLFDAGALSFLL
jgi:hypothetical protein